MNRVILSPEYFPNPTIGRPISNAQIFVGIVDLDPTVLANQKQVSVQQESGTIVNVAQPVLTGAGGVPLYLGSPVTILVSGDYSLAVLDSKDAQIYYVPKQEGFPSGSFVNDMLALVDTTGQGDGDVISITGFFVTFPQSSFYGGGEFIWQDSLNKNLANGGTIIDPANTGSFDGTVSTRDAFLAAQGTGIGTGCWVRDNSATVNETNFGAVGGGVTDDTQAFLSVISVNLNIVCREDITYLITDALNMQDSQTIDLNGSEVQFSVIGSTRCFVLGDNCRIHSGTVRNMQDQSGFGGDFQVPVQIGVRTSKEFRNCVIENLTISTAVTDGNGIVAIGAVTNLVIRNINFDQSATMGRAIMLHWGALGVTPVVSTYHVSNALVENIYCNGMSLSGAGNTTVVFLSAVHNVTVKNIHCFDIPEGAIVEVFAGDYGYQYAPTALVRALGAGEVKIEGIYGKALSGVICSMLSTFQDIGDVVQEWPSKISVEGVAATGYGPTQTLSHGVNISNTSNTSVKNSSFESFFAGGFLGGTSDNSNTLFDGVVFKDSYVKGFDCRFNNSGISLRNCVFQGNNVAAGIGYDIFLGTCSDILIDNCVFDSVLASNNVRLDTGATAPSRVVITLNRVLATGAGPCFSLGDILDDKICTLFNGNTVDSPPSTGIVSGQILVPFSRSSARSGSEEILECYYTAAPTLGTWEIGDKVYDSAAAGSGFIGWVNTAQGTLGTLNGGATTGGITVGTQALVVNDATGLVVGQYITIAGVTGSKRVLVIDGLNITIDTSADATVAGAAVAFAGPPAFKTFGVISA